MNPTDNPDGEKSARAVDEAAFRASLFALSAAVEAASMRRAAEDAPAGENHNRS
jgi:hypothetical protein